MTTAIIKVNHNETYVSPVFAVKYARRRSEIIAFDQSFTHVKRIDLCCKGPGMHIQVFIVENEFEGKLGDWWGFDWVIQDKALQKALRFGKSASIEDFPRFKEYTAKIQLPEWFTVKTQQDINTLENITCGFHDATILEYTKQEDGVVVKFDTSWDCFVTAYFAGVTEMDFEDKVGLILSSEIELTEEGFSFVVDEGFAGWIDGVDYAAPFGLPFIKCKEIFWKIEVSGVSTP